MRRYMSTKRDPVWWNGLEDKSDAELLDIARHRLIRAAQHGDVVQRLLRLVAPRYYRGRLKRRVSSIHYADLYAIRAVEELINRRSK